MRKICLLLCLLMFLSILVACSDQFANLPEMTYDNPSNASNMTFGGVKYYLIDSAPGNIKKDKRVAKVKTEKGLPSSYAYTIKGYNEEDFLIVEEHTIGLIECIYAKESIKSIPWAFLSGSWMIQKEKYIEYNNKKFYFFSGTPVTFKEDNELQEIGVAGKSLTIYSIPEKSETEWIAVKKEDQTYDLYWIQETDLPSEYVQFWRDYGSKYD